MKVTVIDDHDLFREGVIAILAVEPDIDVVAQGRTSLDAVRLVAAHHPDAILLDLELHGDPPRATIASLHRVEPSMRIIVLTMHRDPIIRMEMIRAGVDFYLTKDQPSVDLIRTLRKSASQPTSIRSAGARSNRRNEGVLLSAREMEVLAQMALARSNKTIASGLSIAEGTVKRHTTNISKKLGTRSRMQSVQKAISLGLIAPTASQERELD